jgi:hypothetical protein
MNKTQRILFFAMLASITTMGLRAQTSGTSTTTGGATSGTTSGSTTGGTTTTTTTSTGGTTTTPPPPPTTTPPPPTTPTQGKSKAKGPNENASDTAKAVHGVIAQFQAQRDTYLAERKLLLEKLKTATEAEKKAILEQLREDKAARDEEERTLGKQIREELKKLRDERKSGS